MEVRQQNDLTPFLLRQDWIMQPDEPFSLKIFCDLLNAQRFDSVTVYDPHSDVGPALLRNCRVVPQWEIAKQAIPEQWFAGNALFVSPYSGDTKLISG